MSVRFSSSAVNHQWKIEHIPYMFVVVEKDRDNGTVTLRDRIDGDLGAMSLADAIAKLQQEIADKTVRPVAPLAAPAAMENVGGQEY